MIKSSYDNSYLTLIKFNSIKRMSPRGHGPRLAARRRDKRGGSAERPRGTGERSMMMMMMMIIIIIIMTTTTTITIIMFINIIVIIMKIISQH